MASKKSVVGTVERNEPADKIPVRFELYTRNNRLLGSYETQAEAERMMGAAFNAKYVVGVATNGDRICIVERKELH